MHIPENYLSPMTCAAMGAVMLPIWYKAVKEVKVKSLLKKRKLSRKRLKKMPGLWRIMKKLQNVVLLL